AVARTTSDPSDRVPSESSAATRASIWQPGVGPLTTRRRLEPALSACQGAEGLSGVKLTSMAYEVAPEAAGQGRTARRWFLPGLLQTAETLLTRRPTRAAATTWPGCSTTDSAVRSRHTTDRGLPCARETSSARTQLSSPMSARFARCSRLIFNA